MDIQEEKSGPGIVGVTGGIGSGKSTVGKMLENFGQKVIDVDKIAHDLTAPGSPVLADIAKIFGSDVIRKNGELDRGRVSEIVFHNPTKRRELESLLHPMIHEIWHSEASEYLKATGRWVFVLVPLLFETGIEDQFDAIWLCTAPEKVRVKRIKNRDGLEERQILSRMSAQMKDEIKREKSSVVFDSDTSLENLENQVRSALSGLGIG
ncbi:MAG: dephospho-CoA kinase [bacterium]